MDDNATQRKIETLEKQVQELTNRLNALNQSSTIPYPVDHAWLGRGYLKTNGSPNILINGEDQGNWINRTIPLSGGAEDIYTTQFPSAFGTILEGPMAGYWVPLYIPPRIIL